MIVAILSDPVLRAAVRRASHAEEDVVLGRRAAGRALEFGFPRLLIVDDAMNTGSWLTESGVPTLVLDRDSLRRWEAERLGHELPPRRTEYIAGLLRGLIEERNTTATWVDRTLADLSRAAGTQLPFPLRSFGRRVLEFPSRYSDLHAMAEACHTSRGALKARFRRRGLESPYTYLRWFRMVAVAYHISDRSVTIASAAHRLGFTSDGNLCRAMVSATGLTPTEVRTVRGWNRLLISFAWTYLTEEAVASWSRLDELFEQVA